MSILYSKAITAAIGKKIKNSLPFQHLHREEMTLNPYLSLRSLLLADLVSYKLLSFLSSNNSPNPNITLLQQHVIVMFQATLESLLGQTAATSSLRWLDGGPARSLGIAVN